MERFDVNTLQVGEDVTEFYLVRNISIKVGSTGRKYCDFLLGDSTGDLNAKKWDVSPDDEIMLGNIKEGDIVKVQGKVKDFNNQLQLTIALIRLAREDDPVDREALIKRAPEKAEDMLSFIENQLRTIRDKDFKTLCEYIIKENREKLLYYPAAQRNHHAQKSGLLYHIKRMMMSGLALCEIYPFLDRDLIITGVLIHDIEKLREIESDEEGIAGNYSFEGQMLGHIIQGAIYIDKLSEKLLVPKEKAVLMEHMILSHHYEPEFGSPKKPMFPEAEILHYLDMVDARMYDMEQALSNVERGDFSDRVWTLDNRRLYKYVGQDVNQDVNQDVDQGLDSVVASGKDSEEGEK